ncbi:SDR family oxidoreductase [Pseudalkalibacillus sp. SCS-8]|uniref:dTDP-4-dehydrorhamnose reductase family protein n=1 Tax=Pseudalkalibacillus nanhaiensis TaxID=3115291 RepID=UPI0032DB2C88
MAGHVVTNYLIKLKRYDVSFTHRDRSLKEGIHLDVTKFDEVRALIQSTKPDVVINCVGILNDHATRNLHEAIRVNTLLPHILSHELSRIGSKLIHISTDCVFEGNRGKYTEFDPPDGTSTYAITKANGEVITSPHLTVRTSIIGPELKNGIGLFQWFMKQTGDVNGYVKVFWNGVTTLELAKAIHAFLDSELSGLYHLTAPETVSKYTLLEKIQKTFNKDDVTLIPYDKVACDRTLVNTKNEIHFHVASYDQMLQELRDWMREHENS